MEFEKRSPGRPKGSGKVRDWMVLMQIGKLLDLSPGHQIAGAVRRFAPSATETGVRRIRRRWNEEKGKIEGRIDVIEDTLALSSMNCSKADWAALLNLLEALPERTRYGRLDATAIVRLACSIRYETLMDEMRATIANPALGMVRRIASRRLQSPFAGVFKPRLDGTPPR